MASHQLWFFPQIQKQQWNSCLWVSFCYKHERLSFRLYENKINLPCVVIILTLVSITVFLHSSCTTLVPSNTIQLFVSTFTLHVSASFWLSSGVHIVWCSYKVINIIDSSWNIYIRVFKWLQNFFILKLLSKFWYQRLFLLTIHIFWKHFYLLT